MKTSEFLAISDDPVVGPHRRSFPLRSLMICFTVWLIATEVLIFDQIKFNARIQLFEQATQPSRTTRLLIPTERPSQLPSTAKLEKL